MKKIKLALGLLLILFVAGCGPAVVVENRTGFPVRAIVSSRGAREVVSPSPGESSTVEVQAGAYTVVVLPDMEWIEYAKLTRKVLNDQLANADKLTGTQLLDVIRRLKDIATRMQQYEAAAGSSSKCTGRVQSESTGIVTIAVGADGKLFVGCK